MKKSKFVSGSVSTQVNQNFHAWSTNAKEFDTEKEAQKYADECWNEILNKYDNASFLPETTFCYELEN